MRKLLLCIFIVLCISAFCSGYDSYTDTKLKVCRELNQALTKVLAENGYEIVKQDTIQAYRVLARGRNGQVAIVIDDDSLRRHIRIEELRDKAFIAFTLMDDENMCYDGLDRQGLLQSDTLMMAFKEMKESDEKSVQIAFRGYADCSAATLLSMSDQRLTMFFSLMAMLCLFFQMSGFNKRKGGIVAVAEGTLLDISTTVISCDDSHDTFGGLWYDDDMQVFKNEDGNTISFTPMQRQLMELFFKSDNHRLTKQEICDALWPKKDDASETLYTLIRRFKVMLEANSHLKIESDRGRAYLLREVR